MTLLTKEQAALRARRSVATLDRALAQRQIQAQRIGRRVLFDPAEVDRWVAWRTLPIAAEQQSGNCR